MPLNQKKKSQCHVRHQRHELIIIETQIFFFQLLPQIVSDIYSKNDVNSNLA